MLFNEPIPLIKHSEATAVLEVKCTSPFLCLSLGGPVTKICSLALVLEHTSVALLSMQTLGGQSLCFANKKYAGIPSLAAHSMEDVRPWRRLANE